MKDAYSFTPPTRARGSYRQHRVAYQIFDRFGASTRSCPRCRAHDGRLGVGGFLASSPVGGDTFVGCTSCDYAANVEAVTTPAPAASDPLAWPEMTAHDTPDTPTIESLVALANAEKLGGRADWAATDTLKNVVLKLTHPGGDTEVLVVGVPGDREVIDRSGLPSPRPAHVAHRMHN
jgi:prolyl-tRNA synthetase